MCLNAEPSAAVERSSRPFRPSANSVAPYHCVGQRLDRASYGHMETPMKDGEVVGRLIALEVFSMTALGLYLANSRNDADYSKAAALLDFIRQSVSNSASPLPLDVQAEAAKYADYLVSTWQKI